MMMKELNVANVAKPKVQIKIDFPSEPTPPPQHHRQHQQGHQQEHQQQPQQHILQIEVSDYSDDCPNIVDTHDQDADDVIGERRKKLEIKSNNFLSMSEPSLPTNFLTVPADVHWGNKQRRCSYIFDDISSSGRSRCHHMFYHTRGGGIMGIEWRGLISIP